MHHHKIVLAIALIASLASMELTPLISYADTATTATTTPPAATESAASSTSETQEASTTIDASSSDSSIEASGSASTTSESHDDLDIHATTTGPLPDTDSTSASSSDSTASSSPDTASTTPLDAFESVVDTATTTSSGFVAPTASSTATTSATTSLDASTTPLDTSTDATSTPAIASSTPDVGALAASSSPVIQSGVAIALANILNLLNATFVNSDGAVIFSNYTDPAGTIDFRSASTSGYCADLSCTGQSGIQVHLVQDASIDNDILVAANSGGNTIDTATAAAILSGNAFAGLNLINLANVTFVGAKYMLVTLNAFQGVNGDIVFPGIGSFFNTSSSTSGTSLGGASMNASSTVANNVTAGADTGNNSIASSTGSYIETGSSSAYTNVFNQINSLLAGSGVSLLFRISGDWNGSVVGDTDGISWVRTPGGVLITGSATDTPGFPAIVDGTTTADINNNVSVGATTGSNSISNASSSALISTGDAFAAANIINIANQTVIGRNWIFAIINIFGNFNGNIAFGRPDLWVGSTANAPGDLENGGTVEYKVSVINNGDAPARDALLTESLDPRLTFADASLPIAATTSDSVTFDLGTLPPGKATEVTFHATVHDANPGTALPLTSTAKETDTDNNPIDNTDTVNVSTYAPPMGGGGSYTPPPANADNTSENGSNGGQSLALKISRATATSSSDGNEPVTEQLAIWNDSDETAHDIVLHDRLTNESGALIHDDTWQIGDIAPHQEVDIQYEVVFGADAARGTYTLTSDVVGSNVPEESIPNGVILLVAPPTPFVPTAPLSLPLAPAPTLSILNTSTRKSVETTPVRDTDTAVPANDPGDATSTATTSIPATMLTAAVGTVDQDAANGYTYAAIFVLLFLSIIGALRAFVRPHF